MHDTSIGLNIQVSELRLPAGVAGSVSFQEPANGVWFKFGGSPGSKPESPAGRQLPVAALGLRGWVTAV